MFGVVLMKINIDLDAKRTLEDRRVRDITIYTEMPAGC